MFRFECKACGQWHEGMPAFDAEAPLFYYLIPEHERAARCELSSDVCVVDGKYFFARGCIEIPVHGADEPFVWGVWVSLSEASFSQYLDSYDEPRRAHLGPFFGWLSASFKVYPETEGSLKTHVHLRDDGVRPYIELEHTDHPLAREQRQGIDAARLAQIYAAYMHA